MKILKEYIAQSSRMAKKNQTSFKAFGHTEVMIKDALPENVDIHRVFVTLKSTVPPYFFHDLDMIYIGDFDHLANREVSAVYDSGAIYLSNDQESDSDIIDA